MEHIPKLFHTQIFLFISGQIGINVKNNKLESGFESQARQVFQNILNIIKAKDTLLDLNSILKLTIYLKDLSDFDMLNEIMFSLFDDPYPSRAAVEVSRLPKDALIEIDAIVACSIDKCQNLKALPVKKL